MSDPNHQYDHEFIKCRNCGNEYYKNWSFCPKCKIETKRNYPFTIVILSFVFVIIVSSIIFANTSDNVNRKASVSASKNFSAEPLELPETGIHHLFTSRERLATFTFISGSSPGSKYLKFVNVDTDLTEFTIFIRHEETAIVDVPLGSYEIHFIAGHEWYGDNLMFGNGSDFQTLDKIYTFAITPNGVQSWSLDLSKLYQ